MRARAWLTALVLLAGVSAAFAPEQPRPAEEQPRPSEEQQPEEEPEVIMGRSSAANFQARDSAEAAETIELVHGSRLRLAPSLVSPLVEIVAEGETVPVLERHEEWVRVRYGIWKGWVLADGRDTGLVSSAAPVERQATLVRLDRAREIMDARDAGDAGGAGTRETTLGPYALLTDVRDQRLLERLEPLVASLAESYRERFGVDPGPPRDERIVLFEREPDYREFEREDLLLAGLETEGYNGQALLSGSESTEEAVVSNLTATFVGNREPDLLREILVHELTHMLNRRAVGPYLPPWLEEGLAEDLALSQVDSAGRLVLGSFGGISENRYYYWGRSGGDIALNLTGSRAALQALLTAWHTPYRTELEQLSRLTWEMLVTPASRSLLYAESAFLTRYLLDGAGDESARRFRDYLAEVAAGEAASEAIWQKLEQRPGDLEDGLFRWMRRKATAYGIRTRN